MVYFCIIYPGFWFLFFQY